MDLYIIGEQNTPDFFSPSGKTKVKLTIIFYVALNTPKVFECFFNFQGKVSDGLAVQMTHHFSILKDL